MSLNVCFVELAKQYFIKTNKESNHTTHKIRLVTVSSCTVHLCQRQEKQRVKGRGRIFSKIGGLLETPEGLHTKLAVNIQSFEDIIYIVFAWYIDNLDLMNLLIHQLLLFLGILKILVIDLNISQSLTKGYKLNIILTKKIGAKTGILTFWLNSFNCKTWSVDIWNDTHSNY